MLRRYSLANIRSFLPGLGRRLGRPRFFLFAIAVVLASYQLYNGIVEIGNMGAPFEKSTLSDLGLDIAPLDMRLRHDSYKLTSGYALWDLPIPESKGSSTRKSDTGEDEEISYAQKLFNGVPAVYRKSDEKYRWELYGLVTSRNVREAVFFNPALSSKEQSGWFRFKPGDLIDQGLVLEHIQDDLVSISFKKEQLDFQLELFLISSPVKDSA